MVEPGDDRLSQLFAALADPTRREIVARLAEGDATVGELARPYDMTVQAISKHVHVLADAGLVTQTRDAQRRPCHLEAEVFEIVTLWLDRYRRQAEARFRRLDDLLAEMNGAVGATGAAGGTRVTTTPTTNPEERAS